MHICPSCQKSVRFIQVIKLKRKKHWLVTICGRCDFNVDLEEFDYDPSTNPKVEGTYRTDWNTMCKRCFRSVAPGVPCPCLPQ